MPNSVIGLRKYIGRSYSEYDCFDLVAEFYRDFYQLDLKRYFDGRDVTRQEIQSLIVSNKGDFIRVDTPKFGDIVVIRLYGLECHIGVVTGAGRFLHSARNVGSMLDRLERYHKLIAGYYRHREHDDQA